MDCFSTSINIGSDAKFQQAQWHRSVCVWDLFENSIKMQDLKVLLHRPLSQKENIPLLSVLWGYSLSSKQGHSLIPPYSSLKEEQIIDIFLLTIVVCCRIPRKNTQAANLRAAPSHLRITCYTHLQCPGVVLVEILLITPSDCWRLLKIAIPAFF